VVVGRNREEEKSSFLIILLEHSIFCSFHQRYRHYITFHRHHIFTRGTTGRTTTTTGKQDRRQSPHQADATERTREALAKDLSSKRLQLPTLKRPTDNFPRQQFTLFTEFISAPRKRRRLSYTNIASFEVFIFSTHISPLVSVTLVISKSYTHTHRHRSSSLFRFLYNLSRSATHI
jgi:hypothetical protein